MLRDVLGKTFRFLGYTVQYGCIAHCAFEYLGGIVVCSGPSMEPTIQNSDVVFSENLSRHFYCIRKGDIVIVKSPNDPKSNICKRVIGLEGDKVCTSNPSDFLKSHSYLPRRQPVLPENCCSLEINPRIICTKPEAQGLLRQREESADNQSWACTALQCFRLSPDSAKVDTPTELYSML
ncbi:PREDICTED: mitochondrial inner membrane protease subunit 1 isoform X1 [Lepidothrix coronata]|uniref:Mitochondrial inner membrane protease subunit n=1 Tax=Lepidothrix coronata TaxID=321398 RepID=A0A6J0I754_9PASS|nr:PREDICTED: mitochondrial inner membrane protease subunit 1 isoform X1 [Lepidothrix coronata]